ncbi:MAG: hypothetical protein UX82_C0028G0002 [Microgenomates group bacterium GW2011_GWE1_47_12]|nr:MAG: hypothetical protein UX82_C0028G0002 [Microgenomates group bacterium GW2011_GWE1_47_12]
MGRIREQRSKRSKNQLFLLKMGKWPTKVWSKAEPGITRSNLFVIWRLTLYPRLPRSWPRYEKRRERCSRWWYPQLRFAGVAAGRDILVKAKRMKVIRKRRAIRWTPRAWRRLSVRQARVDLRCRLGWLSMHQPKVKLKHC